MEFKVDTSSKRVVLNSGGDMAGLGKYFILKMVFVLLLMKGHRSGTSRMVGADGGVERIVTQH